MLAAPASRRSLGVLVMSIVVALLGASSLLFVLGYEALERIRNRVLGDTEQMHGYEHEATQILTALVNQEVGLRGYLGSGERSFLEPFQAGQQQEHELGSALDTQFAAIPALAARLEAFDAGVRRWRDTIVEPQIQARDAGPLADLPGALRAGKRAFDDVRRLHDGLLVAIAGATARAQHAAASAIRWINAVVIATAVLVFALGALATRYLIGRVTRPLVELVRCAERQAGFPPPADSESIHEVHALASALHELGDRIALREQDLGRLHEQAVALTQFGEFAQQAASLDEMYDGLERAITRLVAPSKMHILLRNASKNRLELARQTIPLDEQVHIPILMEPMRCRAVRTMREVTANADAPTVCRCTLGVPDRGAHTCLPMLAAGELIGVVNLQSSEPGYFTGERFRVLHGYAGAAGAAISSLELIAATRERALRDSLTGAYNRAFLSEYLPKAIASAIRRSAPVAVALADLDHFKRINDQHGHLIGDQAIVMFARCLQAQTRTGDVVARYGGEEFVIVLVDADAESALATTERIRAAVAELPLTVHGQELGRILRASFGVAVLPQHGTRAEELIAAADAALYRAKHRGRNRVVLAGSDGADGAVDDAVDDAPLPRPGIAPS